MSEKSRFETYQLQISALPLGREQIDVSNKYAWELSRISTSEAHLMAIEVLNNSKELEYDFGKARAFRTIAQCYWLKGDYTSTINNCNEAYDLFKSINDKQGEAEVLNLFGGVYSDMNDYQNSKVNFEKSLEIRKEIGDNLGIVKSMNSIGDLKMKQKDYTSALQIFNECMNIDHDSDMYRGIVLYNIAEANYYLKNLQESIEQILDCQKIGRRLNFDLMEVYSNSLLGRVAVDQNQLKNAIEFLTKALDLAKKIEAKDRVYHILKELSRAYEKFGKLDRALDYYKEFHQIKEEVLNKESAERLKNLKYRHELESIQKEAQIERQKRIVLKTAFDEIERQKNEITQKNKEITSSIKYAERIQEAILPTDEYIKDLLPESFVFYKPKDILSGDFYWLSNVINDKKENLIVAAVVDCTGHGVPGALMSVVGNNFLRLCENEPTVNNPAEALDFINRGVNNTLRQTPEESTIKDGMDMTFLGIDYPNMKFYFAGAKNSLYLVRNGELKEIKGDKHPIGAYLGEKLKPFTNHTISMKKGDQLYIFTDGYADQFGGENCKKLKYKNFKSLLLKNSKGSMSIQKERLEHFLKNWKGEFEQVDDICIMGIKI